MTIRTINKNLVDILLKEKKQNRLKVLDKQFGKYSTQLIENNNTYHNTTKDVNFEKYTLNTIYDKFRNYIIKDKDLNDIKDVLSSTIKSSREYYKQKKRNIKIEEKIDESEDQSLWEYVITHAATGIHSDECSADNAGGPYTKDEALEIMSRKPNHPNCTCYLKEIKERIQK